MDRLYVRLRAIRKQRGLTIRQLAHLFDPPYPPVSQISEWERGNHDPSSGSMTRWIEALGGTITVDFPDLPEPDNYEYGLRVDTPHPRRKEKVGDVISLRPDCSEDEARKAVLLWHGWTLVRRPTYTPPKRPWEDASDAK